MDETKGEYTQQRVLAFGYSVDRMNIRASFLLAAPEQGKPMLAWAFPRRSVLAVQYILQSGPR